MRAGRECNQKMMALSKFVTLLVNLQLKFYENPINNRGFWANLLLLLHRALNK